MKPLTILAVSASAVAGAGVAAVLAIGHAVGLTTPRPFKTGHEEGGIFEPAVGGSADDRRADDSGASAIMSRRVVRCRTTSLS